MRRRHRVTNGMSHRNHSWVNGFAGNRMAYHSGFSGNPHRTPPFSPSFSRIQRMQQPRIHVSIQKGQHMLSTSATPQHQLDMLLPF
jgi:hypothetical protein